jgi:hypothetical protein
VASQERLALAPVCRSKPGWTHRVTGSRRLEDAFAVGPKRLLADWFPRAVALIANGLGRESRLAKRRRSRRVRFDPARSLDPNGGVAASSPAKR